MDGEITNNSFIASLPILSSNTDSAKSAAIDAPTLMKKSNIDFTQSWKGNVTRREKDNSDVLMINYLKLDSTDELLLGGICCLNSCWHSSKGCEIDDQIKGILEKQKKENIVSNEIHVTKHPLTKDLPADDLTNCTVCRWLKSGPCAAEYNRWNAAMEIARADGSDVAKNEFMTSATHMSTCVKKHDYYDVFVAFL